MDRFTAVAILWGIVAIALENAVPAQGPQIAPQANHGYAMLVIDAKDLSVAHRVKVIEQHQA